MHTNSRWIVNKNNLDSKFMVWMIYPNSIRRIIWILNWSFSLPEISTKNQMNTFKVKQSIINNGSHLKTWLLRKSQRNRPFIGFLMRPKFKKSGKLSAKLRRANSVLASMHLSKQPIFCWVLIIKHLNQRREVKDLARLPYLLSLLIRRLVALFGSALTCTE